MKENDIERKIAYCDFCCEDTRHEFIYKSSSFNLKNQEQYSFFVSCLHCDWVQNEKVTMTRQYYESLKPVKT